MTETILPLPILGSLLFTLMGPITAIPLFAANTAEADAALQHRIALRAYLIALAGLAVAVFLGANAMAASGVSPPALIIAAGLILTLMSLRTILSGGQEPRSGPVPAPTLANAVSPIAIPGLVTPMSVAILVIFVSFFPTILHKLVILAVAVGIMTLNLGAMLAAQWFMRVIGPAPLIVLGAVFGVLQAAMGVQMFVSGLALLPERQLDGRPDVNARLLRRVSLWNDCRDPLGSPSAPTRGVLVALADRIVDLHANDYPWERSRSACITSCNAAADAGGQLCWATH